jgi:hypothetical protein
VPVPAATAPHCKGHRRDGGKKLIINNMTVKINNINKKIILRVIIVVVGVASPIQWPHKNNKLTEQRANVF